ncbi:adenosylhomocysteinase [Saccharopolyspora sp. NPDC050389]|uniref:adenosylhomocysteinase n=1 Tax=Saccharopolyspora sp. NPDC050389 TaxID=3155516 RepID=UPI0033C3AD30
MTSTSSPEPTKPSQQSLDALAWAEEQMTLLTGLRGDERGALAGQRIVMRGHITKESAVQVRTLRALGAEIAWCASSPVTTDPDIVAVMTCEGVHIPPDAPGEGRAGEQAIQDVLDHFGRGPTLLLDEGGDLLLAAHADDRELPDILGAVEKTGSGMVRLKQRFGADGTKFPVLAVDTSYLKHVVDNSGGAPQSVVECIMRASGTLLAGRTFVVAGFGGVGSGIARRAAGLGCRVIVTEVRPTVALRALVEGFEVMRLADALQVADVVCTATGEQAVTAAHLPHMRSEIMLANAGHFADELPVAALREAAVEVKEVRSGRTRYLLPDGRVITVLGNGDMINLAVGEGNPSEVMDVTFATQIAALRYLLSETGPREPGVFSLPVDYEEELAQRKLDLMGLAVG